MGSAKYACPTLLVMMDGGYSWHFNSLFSAIPKEKIWIK